MSRDNVNLLAEQASCPGTEISKPREILKAAFKLASALINGLVKSKTSARGFDVAFVCRYKKFVKL